MKIRSAQTFHLETPKDILEMLEWQLGELRSTAATDIPIAGYQMIQCSITAWSMCDWIFESIPDRNRTSYCKPVTKVSSWAFRQWIKDHSPDLSICRYIADAAKHWNIKNQANPDVQTAHFTYEASNGAQAGFWVIIDADGFPRNCERVIEGAIHFWRGFLDHIESIDNSRIEP